MKKLKDILKIIFLVLAILTMTCTLAKKASADSISSYEIQYLEDMMQSWDVYPSNTPVDFASLYSQFESDCNTYPYYVTNNSNYIIMCKKPSFGLVSQYDSSYSPLGVAFNVSDYPNWQDSFPFIVYQAFSPASGWQCVIRFEVYDFNGGMTVLPMRFSWTGDNSYSRSYYTRITGYYANSFSVSNTSWYGNPDSFYRCNGSNGTGYLSGWGVSQLSVTPIQIPYTEDSRLKLSTFSLPSGGEYLQIDIRKIVKDFPISDSSHSSMGLYPEEEINMTISYVDDNDQVTTEDFVLSSDNSVISSKYIFSTNFEIFGDFSDYKDIYVSAVSFSLAGSSQGQEGVTQETYNISCAYYLKQYVNPIVPDEVPFDDTIYSDSVTSSQISITLNEIGSKSVSNRSGIWNNYDLVSTLPSFPSWASVISFDIWQAVKYTDGSISEYYDEYYYRGYDAPQSEYPSWYVETNPFDFPSMNFFSQYYDVLVIRLGTAVKNMSINNTPHDFPTNYVAGDYLILYSARYYQHKNVEGIYKLIDIVQKDANQSVEFMKYVKTRLDDFELKSLLSMGSLIDYAKKVNNLLSTIDLDINNGSDNIVQAINSIRFNPDYTPLISEMELIRSAVINIPSAVRSDLVYLFMPTYDGISVNFNQYHDDIGILALPFDETKLVYDTMKNNYTGNFEIDVPKLKVSGFTIYDGTHFSFDVWSLFDGNKLASSDGTGLGFVKGLRYFIAFVAILGSVASTYAHIFRRENTQD